MGSGVDTSGRALDGNSADGVAVVAASFPQGGVPTHGPAVGTTPPCLCANDPGGASAVQELFSFLRESTCHWTGAEAESSETEGFAEAIKARLDRLSASDFNLSLDEAARLQGTGSSVGYLDVYSGRELTLCIFVLSKGARIPLHDHPHMSVFGRLLFGQMRVISYDPDVDDNIKGVDSKDESERRLPPGACWASLHQDEVLGPAPVTYELDPRNGNIHELHALEDTAFFDLVTPPYNVSSGRGCTYYHAELVEPSSPNASIGEAAGAKSAKGRYILSPTTVGDFTTQPLHYFGPRYEGDRPGS